MENVGILMTIWNILRTFCKFNSNFIIVCGILVFFPFWYAWTEKNPATLIEMGKVWRPK
jgi:hypothetical protein